MQTTPLAIIKNEISDLIVQCRSVSTRHAGQSMPTRWVRNQATETSACTRAHVDPQAKSHRSDEIIPGQRIVKRERRCKPVPRVSKLQWRRRHTSSADALTCHVRTAASLRSLPNSLLLKLGRRSMALKRCQYASSPQFPTAPTQSPR